MLKQQLNGERWDVERTLICIWVRYVAFVSCTFVLMNTILLIFNVFGSRFRTLAVIHVLDFFIFFSLNKVKGDLKQRCKMAWKQRIL